MCTFNITVDEAVMRNFDPYVSREEFGKWLQRKVDEIVSEPHSGSPIARTEEELREVVRERLRQYEAGEMKTIPGKQVFAKIRERYGFSR